MKPKLFFLILLIPLHVIYAQQGESKTFLRLYADNDAFVPFGRATDWGYTGGNRIEIYYPAKTGKSGFFNRVHEWAGAGSYSTAGWGLMQIIIAPMNTKLTIPDKNDYPYAGALFAIHTVQSANADKKVIFQSEYLVGVMGPPSLGKEVQISFHRLIDDPVPQGWDYQLPTDLLLNYHLIAEKFITGKENFNLLGGGEVRCGTMNNALSMHLQVLAGNTRDYFRGLANRNFSGKKPKISASFKTTAGLVFYNALLDGGLFNAESPVNDKKSDSGTHLKKQMFNISAELSSLFALKNFAVSFSQKISSPDLKDFNDHLYGNISVHIKL